MEEVSNDYKIKICRRKVDRKIKINRLSETRELSKGVTSAINGM